jgi:hypothetical protein
MIHALYVLYAFKVVLLVAIFFTVGFNERNAFCYRDLVLHPFSLIVYAYTIYKIAHEMHHWHSRDTSA